MNRSHAAALLLTAFALVVLGVAASTLPSAQPTSAADTGDVDPVTRAHASGNGTPVDRSSVDHLAFPELDVERGVDDARGESATTTRRLAVGVGLFIVGAATVLWRLTAGDPSGESETDDEADVGNDGDEASPPDAPPRRAGHAAATNEVYRAWLDMVAFLDGSPRRTPAELARTAVEAGYPERPVTELTELFRAVRYGGDSPGEESERRARRAVERIRAAGGSNDHGTADGDDGDGAADSPTQNER